MCTRTSLPCIPAFAMTSHKASGNSFSQTLVDLLHSPYERNLSSRTLSNVTDALSTMLRLLREEPEEASWLIRARSRIEPVELCDEEW